MSELWRPGVGAHEGCLVAGVRQHGRWVPGQGDAELVVGRVHDGGGNVLLAFSVDGK